MKVPWVVFWPFCAPAFTAQRYTTLLMSEGYIPISGKRVSTAALFLVFPVFEQFFFPGFLNFDN